MTSTTNPLAQINDDGDVPRFGTALGHDSASFPFPLYGQPNDKSPDPGRLRSLVTRALGVIRSLGRADLMDTKAILAVVVVICATAIYQASNWWERAYATKVSSESSPDGCLRLDTYDAFWVLPSALHRIPNPDPEGRYDLGMQWEAAIFVRAYEVSTGDYLGETIVFDPTAGNDVMNWGDPKKPGRRVVTVSGFPLIDSNRCSDPATLSKLGTALEHELEAARAQHAIWDAEDRIANPK